MSKYINRRLEDHSIVHLDIQSGCYFNCIVYMDFEDLVDSYEIFDPSKKEEYTLDDEGIGSIEWMTVEQVLKHVTGTGLDIEDEKGLEIWNKFLNETKLFNGKYLVVDSDGVGHISVIGFNKNYDSVKLEPILEKLQKDSSTIITDLKEKERY